jgi:hypothetical protein
MVLNGFVCLLGGAGRWRLCWFLVGLDAEQPVPSQRGSQEPTQRLDRIDVGLRPQPDNKNWLVVCFHGWQRCLFDAKQSNGIAANHRSPDPALEAEDDAVPEAER